MITASLSCGRYTLKPDHPDVVLAVNGLPVATLELKNAMSATHWTVENAKHQYRFERDPKDPLFAFKQRCLVHFAVDTELVFMTTKLEGKDTVFLPFNRGMTMERATNGERGCAHELPMAQGVNP